jgi:hypothetical protein
MGLAPIYHRPKTCDPHPRHKLEEAIVRFGKPEIFNADQGSQFTSLPSPPR